MVLKPECDCNHSFLWVFLYQGGMAFHFHVFVIVDNTMKGYLDIPMYKSFLRRFLANLMPDEKKKITSLFSFMHKLSGYFILSLESQVNGPQSSNMKIVDT
jgi:hypothetical protein